MLQDPAQTKDWYDDYVKAQNSVTDLHIRIKSLLEENKELKTKNKQLIAECKVGFKEVKETKIYKDCKQAEYNANAKTNKLKEENDKLKQQLKDMEWKYKNVKDEELRSRIKEFVLEMCNKFGIEYKEY